MSSFLFRGKGKEDGTEPLIAETAGAAEDLARASPARQATPLLHHVGERKRHAYDEEEGAAWESDDEEHLPTPTPVKQRARTRRSRPIFKLTKFGAVAALFLACGLLVFPFLPWKTSQDIHLKIIVWATAGCLAAVGLAPLVIESRYNFPYASAESVGILAIVDLVPLIGGVFGSVWVHNEPVHRELWVAGLCCVVCLFLLTATSLGILVRRILTSKQNPELDEGWLLSFIRCSWMSINVRRTVCVLVPFLVLALFAGWELVAAVPQDPAQRQLHLIILVACCIFISWCVTSTCIFFRNTRGCFTALLLMLHSAAAVGWAVFASTVLAHFPDCVDVEACANLRSLIISLLVLLYVVGGCTGCCSVILKVEHMFMDPKVPPPPALNRTPRSLTL